LGQRCSPRTRTGSWRRISPENARRKREKKNSGGPHPKATKPASRVNFNQITAQESRNVIKVRRGGKILLPLMWGIEKKKGKSVTIYLKDGVGSPEVENF